MNTTIPVTQAIWDKIPEPKGKTAKQIIIDAVNRGAAPASVNTTKNDTVRLGMYFSTREQAVLRKAIAGMKLNFAEYAAGILTGELASGNDLSDLELPQEDLLIDYKARAKAILTRAVKTPYLTQVNLLAKGLEGIHKNSILMGEAPTGSGKGLVIAGLALECTQAYPDERVVVCAPSFAVLRQLHAEYRRVAGRRDAAAGVMVGRQEFICLHRLEAYLDSQAENIPPDTLGRIRAWIDEDGPSHCTEITYPWLVSSLAEVAPEFPANDFSLMPYDSEIDPGVIAHLEHKADIHDAMVIFCSHAMVAFHTKALIQTKGGVRMIPQFERLIVDEAHMLEASFANAYSNLLSLRISLGIAAQAAKKLGQGGRIMQALSNRYKRMLEINRHMQDVRLDQADNAVSAEVGDMLAAWGRSLSALIRKAEEKIATTRKKALKDEYTALVQDLKYERGELQSIMKRREHKDDVRLEFSPIRTYPRVTAGPRSVAGPLRYLWNTLQFGACISATLLTPKKGVNGYSAKYMAARLCIDAKRQIVAAAVSVDWISKPVTLYLPDPEHRRKEWQRPWLMPPTERYTTGLTKDQIVAVKQGWYREAAECIANVACNYATGGSLVLMTSHEAIAGVYRILVKNIDEPDRVIISSQDEHFSRTRTRYLDMVKAGSKPVWLGTGQCWTGIDLRLPGPAKKDLALTDLIIPRLPIGTQQSSTYRNTASNPQLQFSIMVTDMSIMLKQGIGRLVRQRGCGPKRLYVLDRRLQHPAYASLTVPTMAILKPYTKREVIDCIH